MANNNLPLSSRTLTDKSGKERICFACRTKKPAAELIRIARIDGKYFIDTKQNANGRGCHICPRCVPQAIKTRALNKSFKAQVPDEVYQVLANQAPKEYTGQAKN